MELLYYDKIPYISFLFKHCQMNIIKLLFTICLLPFMGICQTEDSLRVDNKYALETETGISNVDMEQLINNYTEFIRESPNDTDLIFKRGMLYVATKQYSNAKDDFNTLIELESEKLSEAYFYRGLSQLLLFETMSGCEDISKARELGFETDYSNLDLMCNTSGD